MKILEKAIEKQTTRRGRAAQALHQGEYLVRLTALGQYFHVADQKGNNTTATGMGFFPTADPCIVAAFKGPPQPKKEAILLRAREVGIEEIVLSSQIEILGNTSGLHSEMAIVQAVYGSKNQLRNPEMGLEIACIGKGVCPDCSGYMAKYGIPHTATRSNAASDWVHPFTGAHFHGTDKNFTYGKAGRSFAHAGDWGGEYKKGWAAG